ncbi:MAG: LamG domain-containing protein [Thaumarchaeota archaeon]|nr:LamG domain-containing protein [Nitrososphaerota archaeon]
MREGHNPVPIVGYTDRLTVQPGQKIQFMVSCDFPSYRAEIVRLRSADFRPIGPPRKEKVFLSEIAGRYKGRKQTYPHGSYGIVETDSRLPSLESFSIQCWIFPTTPKKGVQGLVTCMKTSKGQGLGLFIDSHGAISLALKDTAGKEAWMSTGKTLRTHTWYFVAATFDSKSGKATVHQVPLREFPGDRSSATVRRSAKLGKVGPAKAPILIGASWGKEGEPIPVALFNGKIDNPRIFSRALDIEEIRALREDASTKGFGFDLIADWDFSKDIGSDHIIDGSPYTLHGRLVNCPKTAVTGHNWTGDELDFKRAPEQYGSVYFHDDDLDDCRWKVDFTLEVTEAFKSGIYAAKLESNGHFQYLPFFVRPKRGTATAKIAFLVATYSYLAYGDEHNLSDMDEEGGLTAAFPDFHYPTRPMEKYVIGNRLHSLYDKHSDGSGVTYSSRLRPVLTISPEYRSAILGSGKGAPHQFSADLLIIDWLEQKGFEYDVISDEDLNQEGASLLRPYKVVVTGTHHEYWSGQMLDALEQYLNGGGRTMYMSGNGLYWVTAADPRRPHLVEIRRWGGTQTWKADSGECYLSSTGEMGGLWRNRARAPQRYVGVGFDSQGFDVNRPYKRMPDSFDPRVAFIFDGIGRDELIGDFPNVIQEHGAAGYEIDRVDYALGTPPSTLLLAKADGFSDGYQHVIEENNQMTPDQGGPVNKMVRADMVYCTYPNEGAVFSTSSIAWSGCLPYNNYKNNVSRLTENVLRGFSTFEKLP